MLGVAVSGSVYGFGVVDGVHRLIDSDSQWASALAGIADRMNDGHYERELIEFVVQRTHAAQYTMYDAFSLSVLLTGLGTGEFVAFRVELPERPSGNLRRSQNVEMLQATPAPFRAGFEGRAPDEDGFLGWDEPLQMIQDPVFSRDPQVMILDPGSLPLEIGYTDSSTTWGHLQFRPGLARMAYGWSSLIGVIRR